MNLYQPTISGSLTVSGSVEIIGPFTMSGGSITGTASFASNSGLLSNLDSGSFVGTGSFNTMSSSVSTRVTTIESKYATTGSNIFTGAQTVCANITSTGTIIAQTLNVQQVTSSVVYSSGSNVFGCNLANTQQFTGSVTMTGSLAVFTAGTTPEFQVVTGGTIKGNALTDIHQATGSLRVTGSGNHWIIGGSVGINTTSPDPFGRGDALNVGISATGASDNMALSLNAGASGGRGSQLYMGQGGCRHFTLSSNSTETTIGTVTNTPFRINTCDTTRLYVSSSTGNIGIGTTCPTYHLEVRCAASVASCYYAAMFARSTGANDGVGDLIAFGANGTAAIGGIYRAGASSWGIELQTSSGNTRMRIDNVGIATFCCQVCSAVGFYASSVQSGITIDSTTNGDTIIASRGLSSALHGIVRTVGQNGVTCMQIISTRSTVDGNLPASVNALWGLTNHDMVIATNNTERMRISSAGCIGINNNNPQYNLDLTGADNAPTSTYLRVYSNNRTVYTGIGYQRLETNGDLAIVAGATQTFRTGGTDRITIASTGITCFACQVCAPTFIGSRFATCSGVAVNTTVNTPTTLVNIATSTFNNGIYLFSAYLSGTGAPSTDYSTALITSDANAYNLTNIKAGSNMVISLSGADIRGTQCIFTGANISWIFTRLL